MPLAATVIPVFRAFLITLILGLQGCSPVPETPVTSLPIASIDRPSANPAPSGSTAQECGDGSIKVLDGTSAGRDVIAEDLEPTHALGIAAATLVERWNRVAPTDTKLQGLETVYLTGNEERHLQGDLGAGSDSPKLTLLAPIDASDTVRSLAIRWRRPPTDLEADALKRLSDVLGSLVEMSAPSTRGAGVSACALQDLGPFQDREAFSKIDRRVLIEDEGLAYRVLDADSVVWFTATQIAP